MYGRAPIPLHPSASGISWTAMVSTDQMNFIFADCAVSAREDDKTVELRLQRLTEKMRAAVPGQAPR